MNGNVTPRRIDALLFRAGATGDPDLIRRATRIDALAADLDLRLTEHSKKRAAEQARKRLAELDAERETLMATAGIKPRKRAKQQPRTPIKHGAVGGANQHRMRGEDPCDWCRSVELAHLAAGRAKLAENRAARRAAAAS